MVASSLFSTRELRNITTFWIECPFQEKRQLTDHMLHVHLLQQFSCGGRLVQTDIHRNVCSEYDTITIACIYVKLRSKKDTPGCLNSNRVLQELLYPLFVPENGNERWSCEKYGNEDAQNTFLRVLSLQHYPTDLRFGEDAQTHSASSILSPQIAPLTITSTTILVELGISGYSRRY